MTAFLFAFVLPKLQFLRLSPRCAEVLLANGATAPGSEVATLIEKPKGGRELGYKEPSLAYELDGNLAVQNADLLNAPSDDWPNWLVMTDDIWSHAPDSARAHLQCVASIRGLNYSGGGRMMCIIVARKIDVVTATVAHARPRRCVPPARPQ